MKAATFDQKTQVVIVMTFSAILTGIIMTALWWSCGFGPMTQCLYGVK